MPLLFRSTVLLSPWRLATRMRTCRHCFRAHQLEPSITITTRVPRMPWLFFRSTLYAQLPTLSSGIRHTASSPVPTFDQVVMPHASDLMYLLPSFSFHVEGAPDIPSMTFSWCRQSGGMAGCSIEERANISGAIATFLQRVFEKEELLGKAGEELLAVWPAVTNQMQKNDMLRTYRETWDVRWPPGCAHSYCTSSRDPS